MDVSVECQKRQEGINPRALRRSGLIPAVLYGHKGTESVSLTLTAKTAETLLKKAKVNNTLVDVKIPDISWNGKALVREVQTHPWKNLVYHLSFFSVASQDTLEVSVPLHFIEEAAGVKEGGVLEVMITELPVQCAPGNIPETIEIDVSNMQAGDTMRVEDLVLPQGVVAMMESGEMVATITAPLSVTEAAETEATPEA